MADMTSVKYLYPPNFKGTYDPDEKIGVRRVKVLCTCYSDGSGEEDAIKIKRTDLLTDSGNTPSFLVVEKIWYNVNGLTVVVSYNNDNDEEIARLYSGDGCLDFTSVGGFMPQDDDAQDNEAGDIVFTTENAASGDSYTITLQVRLKD